jgi:hypothetical protein
MGGWRHEGNQTQAEADQGVRDGVTLKSPPFRKRPGKGWAPGSKLRAGFVGNFWGVTVV